MRRQTDETLHLLDDAIANTRRILASLELVREEIAGRTCPADGTPGQSIASMTIDPAMCHELNATLQRINVAAMLRRCDRESELAVGDQLPPRPPALQLEALMYEG